MRTIAASETVDHDRRRLLSTAAMGIAAAGAAGLIPTQTKAAVEGNTIRPFHISVPEEQLVDLRKRINATKWPDRETVKDPSQGVQLATMQELAHYWAKRTRLAQDRGETECPAAIHHRDRRARHSFHPCPLEA